MCNVKTVYSVTVFRTNISSVEYVDGYGQEAISKLRKMFPRHTKFVFEGFEIGGKFIPFIC